MLQVGVCIIVVEYGTRAGFEFLQRLDGFNTFIGLQSSNYNLSVFPRRDSVDKAVNGQ